MHCTSCVFITIAILCALIKPFIALSHFCAVLFTASDAILRSLLVVVVVSLLQLVESFTIDDQCG